MAYNPFSDLYTTFQSVGNPRPEKVTDLDIFTGIETELPWASGRTSTGAIIVQDNLPDRTQPKAYFEMEVPVSSKYSSSPQQVSGNRKKAMDYFQSKGLTKHAAAGLVGNLIRESGLDPSALNKKNGALGIAQWLGDRKKALISKYGKNPTFEQQLDFIWEELNSTHKKGLQALQNSQTVDEAAANAFGWFEFQVGPKGAIAEMRKYGQDGLGAYNKGIKFAKELI